MTNMTNTLTIGLRIERSTRSWNTYEVQQHFTRAQEGRGERVGAEARPSPPRAPPSR